MEKPSSFGNWPTTTMSAIAFRYPSRIGFDSRSVTNPSLRNPATSKMRPTRTARIPARASAVSGSPVTANGATAAAIRGASDESGPRTRIFDGPTTAYARSGTMVAYRPAYAGNPAASA